MKALHIITWILLIIGGLNWLLIGVGVGNVVAYLGTTVSMIVYVLVGLSAIYEIITHKKNCTCCKAGGAPTQSM